MQLALNGKPSGKNDLDQLTRFCHFHKQTQINQVEMRWLVGQMDLAQDVYLCHFWMPHSNCGYIRDSFSPWADTDIYELHMASYFALM